MAKGDSGMWGNRENCWLHRPITLASLSTSGSMWYLVVAKKATCKDIMASQGAAIAQSCASVLAP